MMNKKGHDMKTERGKGMTPDFSLYWYLVEMSHHPLFILTIILLAISISAIIFVVYMDLFVLKKGNEQADHFFNQVKKS